MGEAKDFYKILSLQRGCSSEEIREAYHVAVRKVHPDVNPDPQAVQIFLGIQEAYETLSDPDRRAKYDASLPPLPPSQVKISWLYSQPGLLRLAEPQCVYFLLTLEPASLMARPAAPLNLCLVLDRSTSMRGERLEMLSSAVSQLLSRLTPEDALAIVTFSDRAEVLHAAERGIDQAAVQKKILRIQASGGTEIFQGLEAGLNEIRRRINKNAIHHMILLTDGRTYGDEPACLNLAEKAGKMGIGITTVGIGGDWNDAFLDQIAAATGTNSFFIEKPHQLFNTFSRVLDNLTRVAIRQVELRLNPSPGARLRAAYRIEPEPLPLPWTRAISLGDLPAGARQKVLLEWEIPALGERPNFKIADCRISYLSPPPNNDLHEEEISCALPILSQAEMMPPPPPEMMQILSRVTLYRMQESVRLDIAEGRYSSACLRLKRLATHLVAHGEDRLAHTALLEAENIEKNQSFSRMGEKLIKYGTRALLLPGHE